MHRRTRKKQGRALLRAAFSTQCEVDVNPTFAAAIRPAPFPYKPLDTTTAHGQHQNNRKSEGRPGLPVQGLRHNIDNINNINTIHTIRNINNTNNINYMNNISNTNKITKRFGNGSTPGLFSGRVDSWLPKNATTTCDPGGHDQEVLGNILAPVSTWGGICLWEVHLLWCKPIGT